MTPIQIFNLVITTINILIISIWIGIHVSDRRAKKRKEVKRLPCPECGRRHAFFPGQGVFDCTCGQTLLTLETLSGGHKLVRGARPIVKPIDPWESLDRILEKERGSK